MSFGWSAGDIVSAISFVNTLLKCLRDTRGSRSHFRELESELDGLRLALEEISEMADMPGQTPEIIALKFVACSCEETLKRFYDRVLPFSNSLGFGSTASKFKAVPKMVRWELLVKKDIPELRSYLVAHVGYLNLRLNSALLKTSARLRAEQKSNYSNLGNSLQSIEDQVKEQTVAICQKICSIPQQDTIPKLDCLLDMVAKVWTAQHNLTAAFSEASKALPDPDLKHTWLQAPVRLEDALGRIVPVPSEYDWETLEAVIRARFRHGPGSQKVHSGEYELFDDGENSEPLSATNSVLIPGMSIRMCIIIGQYVGSYSERCPKLGCGSKRFARQTGGGRLCEECHTWSRKTRKPLLEPLREESLWIPSAPQKPWLVVSTRRERRSYMNLSIYITELPPTPLHILKKHLRDENTASIEPFAPAKYTDRQIEILKLRNKSETCSRPHPDLWKKRFGYIPHFSTNYYGNEAKISVGGPSTRIPPGPLKKARRRANPTSTPDFGSSRSYSVSKYQCYSSITTCTTETSGSGDEDIAIKLKGQRSRYF